MVIRFYTRSGCHLCEAAEVVLRSVQAEMGFQVEVIDIDQSPDARALYHEEVPVTLLPEGRRFRYALDRETLRMAVQRVQAGV